MNRPPSDVFKLADGLRGLADELQYGMRAAPQPGQGVRRVGGAPVVPVAVHDALCGVRVATRQEGADDGVMVCAGCGMAYLAVEVEMAR